MVQMQARGYIQDGQLFTDGLLGKIPTDRVLMLTIAWNEVSEEKATKRDKERAFHALNGILAGHEIDLDKEREERILGK